MRFKKFNFSNMLSVHILTYWLNASGFPLHSCNAGTAIIGYHGEKVLANAFLL